MGPVATPTEIKQWPVIISVLGVMVGAVGLLIGIPIAAAHFDDPSRLLWLLTVPVLVAFGCLSLIREPVRVIVSDGGIELAWLGRTRRIDVGELARIVTPKRRTLLGEGLLLMLQDGTEVEVANFEGRVLMALSHHLPDVPVVRSDSGYLSP